MMSEFFRTRMGQCFYEATMPSLVRELARLNANLERLLAVVDRHPRGGEGERESEPKGAR